MKKNNVNNLVENSTNGHCLCNPQVLQNYQNLLVEGIKQNAEGSRSCNATYDAIITSCQQELKKQDITVEERKSVFERMMSVAKMKSEKNTEDKQYNMFGIISVAAVIGVPISVWVWNQLKN